MGTIMRQTPLFMTERRFTAENMKNIIKTALCILTAALVFSSCTSAGESPQISMYDLRNAMIQGVEFGDMTYVSSSDGDAEKKIGRAHV